MVHALRRAYALVRRTGCVIDLHPTAEPARVFVGEIAAGIVDAGDAPERHAAAGRAIDAAVAEGLLVAERAFEFDFSVWADTLDELDEHIRDDWQDARIGEATMERARRLLEAAPADRPRVRERIRITRLQPSAEA
jgi:hypothetical protein